MIVLTVTITTEFIAASWNESNPCVDSVTSV